MKHQTINLVKFKALQKRLAAPMCHVVGYLETLWIFCQIQAQDGDLSRYSPLEIAGWIDYPGDPQNFVDALVETRWLDRVGDCLLVHDWGEHKPNWLRGVEAKRRPKDGPGSQPSTEPGSQPSSQPGSEPSWGHPNLTQPNLTNAASWAAEMKNSGVDVESVRRLASQLLKSRPNLEKDWVWNVCYVGWCLGAGMVEDWISRIRSGTVQKPKRYLETALDRECQKKGFTWEEIQSLIKKPTPAPQSEILRSESEALSPNCESVTT